MNNHGHTFHAGQTNPGQSERQHPQNQHPGDWVFQNQAHGAQNMYSPSQIAQMGNPNVQPPGPSYQPFEPGSTIPGSHATHMYGNQPINYYPDPNFIDSTFPPNAFELGPPRPLQSPMRPLPPPAQFIEKSENDEDETPISAKNDSSPDSAFGGSFVAGGLAFNAQGVLSTPKPPPITPPSERAKDSRQQQQRALPQFGLDSVVGIDGNGSASGRGEYPEDSMSGEPEMPKPSASASKKHHNEVERCYRLRLNDKIDQLSKTLFGNNGDGRDKNGSSGRAKPPKCMIIAEAKLKIEELRANEQKLIQEVELLRNQIAVLSHVGGIRHQIQMPVHAPYIPR